MGREIFKPTDCQSLMFTFPIHAELLKSNVLNILDR